MRVGTATLEDGAELLVEAALGPILRFLAANEVVLEAVDRVDCLVNGEKRQWICLDLVSGES